MKLSEITTQKIQNASTEQSRQIKVAKHTAEQYGMAVAAGLSTLAADLLASYERRVKLIGFDPLEGF